MSSEPWWHVHERRWFLPAVVGLGTLLASPSLGAGFVADDYFFLHRLENSSSIFALYEFARGEPGQLQALMNSRWLAFPWWAAAELKLCFWRPLSSALFALDHALFGSAALGYHVHSLLWFALLLLAVGRLLRAICPAPLWQLAFVLYALCSSHLEPASWISSRHMLVSAAPALLGLLALVERRQRGFRAGLPLGLLGLLVGLAGGEAALSVVLLWLAYEVLGASDRPSWRERAARAAWPLALAGVYLLTYKLLGYGAANSAAYLDPLASPITFLARLPLRFALLLGEIFTGFPSSLGLTTHPTLGVALGVLSTLGVLAALRSVWPALTERERRALRWLGVGGTLSLLVGAGAFLGPRLVLIPGLAGFVALACVIRHGFAGGLTRYAFAALMLVIHALLSPLVFVAMGFVFGRVGASSGDAERKLDTLVAQRRAAAGRAPRIFILAASDPFIGFYTAAARAVRAPGSTGQWTLLSSARATHDVERTAPSELTLRIEPGLLRGTFEGLFRSPEKRFSVNDRAPVSGGFVTVLAIDAAGRPTKIALTLEGATFDDPDVCLLAWRAGALVPVELAVNERIEIPWSPGPTGTL